MSYVFRSTVTDPRGRGREFGECHAAQIRASVEAYRGLFERSAGGPVDMLGLGGKALVEIAAFAAPLHEEILGMAEGAGLDAREIGAINARTEILAFLGAKLRGECSTVVHVDPARPAPIAVQTWDWYSQFENQWLVWEIPHADGRLTTTVTEYGIVGKIGVNNRGLGVHFNILHHFSDGLRIGVPVHVASRWMLDSQSDINDALQLFAATDFSASSSLTVLTSKGGEGAALSVEIYPEGPAFVFPGADGLLVHTNHFLDATASQGDTEWSVYPDTLLRHDLLTRRLANRRDLTPAKVISAMNSHLGSTGAVCCHPDPNSSADQYQTLVTVVIDVAAGSLQALAGGPCVHVAGISEQSHS
ncbi:C45 family peptidase [Pseudomonas sp. LS1212]|uniref:C45 family autoproteolytic acyltransferase/hydolase n=1 Tax=Pseudomonas sp. LS1212 TaxID=2972478 RepID=UPI00215CD5F1|nr:C45 family peptidase [Pseudomonas sp. LS1212]UVJ45654.1 C45 family peptidase [Pseudomonas sp. LS1212]